MSSRGSHPRCCGVQLPAVLPLLLQMLFAFVLHTSPLFLLQSECLAAGSKPPVQNPRWAAGMESTHRVPPWHSCISQLLAGRWAALQRCDGAKGHGSLSPFIPAFQQPPGPQRFASCSLHCLPWEPWLTMAISIPPNPTLGSIWLFFPAGFALSCWGLGWGSAAGAMLCTKLWERWDGCRASRQALLLLTHTHTCVTWHSSERPAAELRPAVPFPGLSPSILPSLKKKSCVNWLPTSGHWGG